jgi:L-lactate dehydrogenase complex protein LldF
MGIERIVPTFVELDIIFSMLVRSAVGAKLTSYLSFMTGPKGEKDKDGPEELYIIIVDNGRSKVLESGFRDVLRCIRCGTCMLECPAYRHISGHGYGTLYPGPLGLALVPILAGYEEYKDVTKICSLCGACNDVCPVKIPLYQTIIEHRRVIAEEKKILGKAETFGMEVYSRIIGSSSLYDLGTKLARFNDLLPKIGPLKEWYKERELPYSSRERFRDWYRKHKKGNVQND